MAHAIVRAQTPEEREYARYMADVEARRRRAADLQAELASLKLIVGRFEAEYHARVGTLFVALDQVRLAIGEYEQRITRLQTDPGTDPTEVEQEVHTIFEAQREEVRAEEEETRRYERAFAREQARPQLDADTEADLRRLYRELAKRYHPDLARTDAERQRREAVMQRVNAAFQERNLEALRTLEHEAEIQDPAFEARSIGEKLVWAIREVARLDGVIAGLETDLAAVRASDTHGLWSREEAGERVIEMLEDDLRRELVAERERLAELIATYRHLLDRGMA